MSKNFLKLNQWRQDYKKGELSKISCHSNPFQQFLFWMDEVKESPILEPNAMTLATVNDHGQPTARTVLLKQIKENGFVFFSNYNSRKGAETNSNQLAALHFFWPPLERQLRVEGQIQKIPKSESEAYFHSRPKGSQLGAIASPQSQIIPSRKYLEDKLSELEKQYENESEIPLPNNWGGYILVAKYFEFWQGRTNRLHDRIAYKLDENNKWNKIRLAP